MKWRTVALKDVCKIVGGGTPPSAVERYWGGDIVWVTPTDLGKIDSPRISTSIRKITREGFEACGAEMLPASAVVMSSRAPIGHLAIADTELCTNQGCKSFVCIDDLDPEFLYFALRFHMPAIQELGSGATFSEVSKSQLENFQLTIPALSDQKRIASILNKQMDAFFSLMKAAERQLQDLERLPGAFLRRAFAGEL